MLHHTFLNFVFFQRAYQLALSRYSNTDAFQRDLTIFQVPTFQSSSKKRYFIFSTSKERPVRRKTKAFPSEAAFCWLPSLKAFAPLAWQQLQLQPIRRHVASFAAFSLPLAVLKHFGELEMPRHSTSYRSTSG